MASAIIGGLVRQGMAPELIQVVEPIADQRTRLLEQWPIRVWPQAQASLNSAHLVVWAVKPQAFAQAANEAGMHLTQALHLSVAAGIRSDSIAQWLGSERIVRAMPNTPSVVGLGVTGISKGSNVSAKQLDLAIELFSSVGKVLVVDESKIDALSTISGSGPAYVFYFAEKLITAAKSLGFSEQEASLMVKETFLGSATLLATSSSSPEELRQQVTSPNGTTMQATGRFDAADLERVFIEATEAALARAKELGRVKP